MKSTYIARIILEQESDLSKIETILDTTIVSEPNICVRSNALEMNISPYKDINNRLVVCCDVNGYLIKNNLIPICPKQQNKPSKQLAHTLLKKLEGISSTIILYRISATDTIQGDYNFFGINNESNPRDINPFVRISPKDDRIEWVPHELTLFRNP